MALTRFTESFSVQLGENTKSLNESSTYSAKLIPFSSLKESVSEVNGERFVEDSRGNKYKCLAAYRVPVSRFTKNENGRIYPKNLWEKVIKEQSGIWEGGPGLANHPQDDDDGDVSKQFCVWRNLGINESTQMVEADMMLLDDGAEGKKANSVLEAGGKLGLSTSGFGELKEDKSTVDESSFMLERVSDWVLNPSQKVFADATMKKKESVKEETNTINESTTIIRENTTMEKAEKVKLSKAEIRSFKEKAGEWFEEALTIEDPQDRFNELNELHSYFEGMEDSVLPEVRTKIQESIKTAETEISVAIKEHTKLKSALGFGEVDKLKESVKKVAEDTFAFKKDSEEWKTIAEGLQDRVQKLQAILETRPTTDAYRTVVNFSKKLKEEIEEKNTMLEQARVAMGLTLQKEIGNQKSLQDKINLLEGKLKEYLEKNKKLREHASNLSEELKDIKEAQQARANKARQAKLNEETINIAPKGKANNFQGFDESKEVMSYYNDLIKRDGGQRARALKEKILSCKTVREAAVVYFNDFASEDIGMPQLSEAIDPTERMSILKERGVNIAPKNDKPRGLPQGWV